jgi:predicted molibdopterin-dependent oxidoreductase YjgC
MDISGRMGLPMNFRSKAEIMDEIGSLWPAMAGIDYQRLDQARAKGFGGLQWPCPSKDHPGTEYLHKAGFPIGKAPFTTVRWEPPAETPDEEYPFVLTTGRNLFQYHSGSMTRRVKPIEVHAGKPYVELNPSDAEAMHIKDGDTIKVTSRRGSIDIGARVTAKVPKGVVFVPMHYREAAANVVTNTALDPQAKTPELKACAVRIEKTDGKK